MNSTQPRGLHSVLSTLVVVSSSETVNLHLQNSHILATSEHSLHALYCSRRRNTMRCYVTYCNMPQPGIFTVYLGARWKTNCLETDQWPCTYHTGMYIHAHFLPGITLLMADWYAIYSLLWYFHMHVYTYI